MDRVITYIDGYNLYYGLRDKKWQRYYWLNLQELAKLYLRGGQTLAHTKSFTTIIEQPKSRNQRQAALADDLSLL